ncbi:MAG: hypothetical protein GY795_08435 [Desulfobacterales bacterium]|nr:hypothetical protein [Desulfobacterales bacterium]
MSEQTAKLLVKIEVADMDKNELEDLTRLLQEDIESLDVESVEPVKGGDVPEGAMAGEWVKVGSLVVKLSKSVIQPVINAIESWLKRRDANRIESSSVTNLKIKIGLGPLTFEMDKSTSGTENIIKKLEEQA